MRIHTVNQLYIWYYNLIHNWVFPGCISKVRLATVVEGNRKAPFSIATTQGVGEGATPFPGLLHVTLDPYLIMLSVKQRDIEYHFLNLCYDSTWDWTQVSRAIGEHSNHHANVWPRTSLYLRPSRLGLQNTSTASLQRGKTPPKCVLLMTLNNLVVGFH